MPPSHSHAPYDDRHPNQHPELYQHNYLEKVFEAPGRNERPSHVSVCVRARVRVCEVCVNFYLFIFT